MSNDNNQEDLEAFHKWIAESESKISIRDTTQLQLHAFEFNPNTVSNEQMISLGFSEKTASRIINYRNKGGKFYKKKDLLKIYGISEARVEELWENIIIPKKQKSSNKVAAKKHEKKESKIVVSKKDLNIASSESLMKIRGIGPVLSERIVKYRNSLGGFNSTNQLMEVYGLKLEVIEKIETHFEIENPRLAKLNINADSLYKISKHPYISYSMAKIISAYKDQHGFYQSVEELKKIKTMNDSLFQKISPYLVAEIPTLIE